jgi:hypothetical protein
MHGEVRLAVAFEVDTNDADSVFDGVPWKIPVVTVSPSRRLAAGDRHSLRRRARLGCRGQ